MASSAKGGGGGGSARPLYVCGRSEHSSVHSARAEKKGRTRGDLVPAGEGREEIGPELSRVCRGLEPNPHTSSSCTPPSPPFFLFSFELMCTGDQGDGSADTFSMGPSPVPLRAKNHNLRDGARVRSLERRRFELRQRDFVTSC